MEKERTITMFQFMECFANLTENCEVTLINLDNNLHKYHLEGSIYVDLSKPHTLPEWCSIFNGFGVCFDDILVRCWDVKGVEESPMHNIMINKVTVFIKEA